MKNMIRTFSVAITCASLLLGACAKEISHTESDKPGWFGGTTHKETTVYKNPDGTITTEHEEHTVKP